MKHKKKGKVNIEAETVRYDNVDNFRKCIEIKTHAENFQAKKCISKH